MKTTFFWFILICFIPEILEGQITLEQCRQKARENYPLIKRYELIEKSRGYNLKNASKAYLPQGSFNAKATYQSEVTGLPVTLPGIDIEGISKDQYQANVEINQVIWDGGEINKQRSITRTSSEVETKQLEVELYTLNERVENLFFSILLLDAQLKQNALLQEELKRNYNEISSYVQYGIANQSDLDAVRVNQLNASQQAIELTSLRNAYRRMLATMTGISIENNELQKPEEVQEINQAVNRPELTLFEAQDTQLKTREEMIAARNRPKLGVFFQGGYGRPGLNMLKNEFTPYYMTGVRISWNLSGLYTQKNEKRLMETDRETLSVQRETFLFNTSLEVTQQNSEINKIRSLMKDDEEIIRLRKNITHASEAKVKNGTLSVTDLLRDITAEDQAKQNKILHEIQLLTAIYKIKNITNN